MFIRFRTFCLMALVAIAAHLMAPMPCHAQTKKVAYIRLDAASHEEFNAAINFIEDHGAVLRHRIYPYAAMGEIPEGTELILGTAPAMSDVFVGEIPASKMTSLSKKEKWLAKAYNNVYFATDKDGPFTTAPTIPEDPVPIDLEPRIVPEESIDRVKAMAAARGVPPPLFPATSEFLLGHMAVGVILTESQPGFGSQNWAALEEEIATEEVISAMDWWARHSPNQELRFSYEIHYRVPVTTEPMDDGGDAVEAIWAGDSFNYLGYPRGDHIQQGYSYIFDMRERYHADWGFSVFILHGTPGQQFDGFLAYAYLGGPYNVNTYSNGYLGPYNVDRVIAHESGHTFYTLDEYPNNYANCTSRSGYLNAENANQQRGGTGCKSSVPCVMRGGSQPTPFDELEPCYYTRGQVGWWDTDEDGIPDILDTEPIVKSLVPDTAGVGSIVVGDTLLTATPSFKGTIEAVPIENMNSRSMANMYDFTVESVSAQYRVDRGPWRSCQPMDGSFDGPVEVYRFTLDNVSPWAYHAVEVRAVTAHGNFTPDDLVASGTWFIRPSRPAGKNVWLVSSNPSSLPVSISFSPWHGSGAAGLPVPTEIAIYDVLGRKISTLETGDFVSGELYSVEWDGFDANGERAPAGIYFVGISSQGRLRADKLILIP